MTSLIEELRRRNVLSVAATYAVVAWIIIEAGSVLMPTFGASESAFQTYVVVVVAGFLVSLVLAWVFEVTPEGVENPRQVQFGLMTAFSVFVGDFDKARKYAELRNPGFAADADPEVNAFNVADIISYAFILQNQGENQRADALLEASLTVVRTLPRIGLAGHGIRDVQILALQGKTLEALAAFRDAIDEGFRGTVASNGWPLVVDPYLDSLRGQPAFQVLVTELDDAVAVMHQRVSQAEESGNWDDLRALVEST